MRELTCSEIEPPSTCVVVQPTWDDISNLFGLQSHAEWLTGTFPLCHSWLANFLQHSTMSSVLSSSAQVLAQQWPSISGINAYRQCWMAAPPPTILRHAGDMCIFWTCCWMFCRLHVAIVLWQAPWIPLHSHAGTVKQSFMLHKQSLAVAQLAIVCTMAVLEGPLQVGPTNFWKSPLRGLYVSIMIILQYSMRFYDLQIRMAFCVYDVWYDFIVCIFLLFSNQAQCLVNTCSTLWPRGHPQAVSKLIPYYSVVFRVLLITPKYLQKPF